MDEQLKEKLFEILNELPDENAWLDYKIIPYEKSKRAEFIKDLCGFLNSEDSYMKDKFIIMGVSNSKKRVGILENPIQDDWYYQQLADLIEPRPSIETGTFDFKIEDRKYPFGYIFIPSNNNNRIYSISKTFPEQKNGQRGLEDEDVKESIVYASTAYIRRGSCNYLLSEYERRDIYEKDRKTNMNMPNMNSVYNNIRSISENDKILKTAILLGGWDENNENDKKIISDFVGKPYDEWIYILRTILRDENSILEFKNNQWKIKNRHAVIKDYAINYFRDDIILFKTKAIEVLSERNPKFDLDSSKRNMANIYNKNTRYSKLLRQSIAATLPMITSTFLNFKNCENEARNASLLIVREVLKTNNWEIWGSLDNLLPLLAEAAPEEFLNQLDDKIKNNPNMIKKLFTEKETGITTYNYVTGIYWALELIAWEPRNLIEACMLLSRLAIYDQDAIKHIANIILPWYPQTKAPIENREIVVKNILKESIDIGWKLILELMPGKITIASPSYKPKWNNLIEENNIEVLQVDYWKQINTYIDLAITYSKTDTDKICDLIDIIDDVPKDIFEKICNKLSSNRIIQLSETRRYAIWNYIEDVIVRHTSFSSSNWALPQEAIDKLKKLSKKLKPKNVLIYAKRFFRKDTWNIINDKKDYKKSEENLHNKQLKLVKSIINLGIKSIIDFSKVVEDPYIVGICVAELLEKEQEEILNCLQEKNKKLIEFGKGFVYKKFNLNGYEWIKILNIKDWNKPKKLNLLLVLPCNNETFDLVKKNMGQYENEYWKKVDIRIVDEINDLNYAITKLLEVDRPNRALWIISSKLYNNKECKYDKKIAVKCLKAMLHHQEEFNSLDYHHIIQIIKNLQETNFSKKELFKIEWAYLPLLKGEECKPITIEQTISEDPKVYNDLLSLAYKPHKMKENPTKVDEKIATNAYRLLDQWEIPPGLINGTIDRDKLNKWYNEMIKICKDSDRLEVGLSNFGKVLYHSPKDKSGFWIDRNVADLLNQENADNIRNGFRIEAYNSLGVVNYDSEGKVFENLSIQYEEKANAADKEGFYRLAKEMRKLSDTYKHEAEEARQHYYD